MALLQPIQSLLNPVFDLALILSLARSGGAVALSGTSVFGMAWSHPHTSKTEAMSLLLGH